MVAVSENSWLVQSNEDRTALKNGPKHASTLDTIMEQDG